MSRVNHRHIPFNGDRDGGPDGHVEGDLDEGQDPGESKPVFTINLLMVRFIFSTSGAETSEVG